MRRETEFPNEPQTLGALMLSAPPDERPGDYLPDSPYALSTPHITRDRYPEPAPADLVTLWKKGDRIVLSVTSAGRVQDFYMSPGRLAYLIRELAEILSENAIIQ